MNLAINIFLILALIICIPIYFVFCLTIPFFKFGKTNKGGQFKVYILNDLIHSDYVFESKLWPNIPNPSNFKYIKIGWGDKKIFLETPEWKKLKIKDLAKAFFGMNNTVLKIEFLNNIEKIKFFNIKKEQFDILKKHVYSSTNWKLVNKKSSYYQIGDFYESDLKYNCIMNCNNWINLGLRKAKISNRIWSPLTFWI